MKTCADPGIFARGFFEVSEGVQHFPGGGGGGGGALNANLDRNPLNL